MASFMSEGGWGMYPVLVLGLWLSAAALRTARDCELRRLQHLHGIARALLAAMGLATVSCLAAVFEHMTEVAPQLFASVLMQGLLESTRPVILGSGLLTLALVLVSVATARAQHAAGHGDSAGGNLRF
jgi:hypothetical protein